MWDILELKRILNQVINLTDEEISNLESSIMKKNRLINFYEKVKSFTFFILSFLLLANVFTACSDDDNIETPSKTEWLRVVPLSLNYPSGGGEKSLKLFVTEDVIIEDVFFDVQGEWYSVRRSNDTLYVNADINYETESRATILNVSYGKYKREIPISQEASKGSQKLVVKSATSTSEETVAEDRGLEKSYDGNSSTWFNSKFGAITEWPFNIEYTLDNAERLDYLLYYPRSDSGNKWGAFNKYSVYATTKENPTEYIKIGDFERGDGVFTVHRIDVSPAIVNPLTVKFEVWSAYNNRVSIQEMEFYQGGVQFDYSQIFVDDVFSELKPDITESMLRKIPDAAIKQLAFALLNKSYDVNYRVASFRPYQDPSIMATTNKTEKYSLRDNPTGIYMNPNEEMTIVVGNTKGQELSVIVQDLSNGFNSALSFPLVEGVNKITPTAGGLLYVSNLTTDNVPLILKTSADEQAVAEKTVNIHFVYGKVNGYFDIQKHTQEDWEELLKTAKYKDLDVLGERAHITWTTSDFVSKNTDIITVLNKYDRLVYLEQEFLGLEKYNKMFRNRMYFHIDYNGASPYATAYRTAYTSSYSEIFCIANRFEARLWGPAHEVGHINQTRPGMKWTGTTEVTNNIMSMYIQQQFGQTSKLTTNVSGTTKSYYQIAKEVITDAGQPHATCDRYNGSLMYELKLVPFWQLKLYLVDALGQKDFYHDLYEHFRVTDNLVTTSTTEGILQLDFVRQACRISGYNLLDFFGKWGFLTPVDVTISDYGNKKFTITQAQINALKTEINAAGYATPKADLNLITEDNLNSYK